MKKRLGLLSFFLLSIISCRQDNQNISNLETFAKAYGYVKYFHPSDEASSIDWDKFSAYGAQEILKCRTNTQVINTLNDLFNPIAPSVTFSLSDNSLAYDFKIITPDNPLEYRITFWQHLGTNIGMNMNGVYESLRVNRNVTQNQKKLFDFQPEFTEVITKEIGNHLYCQIPLSLYCNDKNTYPKADSVPLKKLIKELGAFNYDSNKSAMRLGNIINVYNVMQHFYPYFDVVKVNWGKELNIALLKSFNDKSPEDHLQTLQRFTASLHDGHGNVFLKTKEYYSPPITWEWVENKLVITNIYDKTLDIHVGDTVTTIDGINSKEYFERIYPLVSAATEGWLNYKANFMSLTGDRNSKLKLTVNGKSIELFRKRNDYRRINENEIRYKNIEDGIWYLNLDKIEMDTINKIIPELLKSRAIICDARGYPAGNHELLMHFLKSDDTAKAWMQIPQIIYPDHEKITGYAKYDWIDLMKAKEPYLGDKRIVYIIDGSAISYAECCLGFIEGYNLAIKVGQPTAGTNGNVNPFSIPGGYTISWTGMKVVKHNGSQHHGVGIIPDIYVSKTIKGIKEHRDEFLEKAIEIAKK